MTDDHGRGAPDPHSDRIEALRSAIFEMEGAVIDLNAPAQLFARLLKDDAVLF